MATWGGFDSEIAAAVETQNQRLLRTYRADPKRLEEDANTERSIYEGAYAQRQVHELLQNAADAMRTAGGRCEVLLTDRTLYVANSGEALSVHGVETLMAAHLSGKRDEQIGRFGLGFKSVLAVTDAPKIFSRSGSLGFDRSWARRQLAFEMPDQAHYPTARLAECLDPVAARQEDPILEGLMKWATTVVVLPQVSRREMLAKTVKDFPAEFVLFSQHVAQLDLEDRAAGIARRVSLTRDDDGLLRLDDAGKKSKWVVASRTHTPSAAAMKDGGYQASRESVELVWAAPVEGANQRIGRCWAYFPTDELTTLSGIINAPWKLTDDRARLLSGDFNDELLTTVLPGLVTSALPALARPDGPGAAIDVLPARGKELRGYADMTLGGPVIESAAAAPSIPNMTGRLSHPTRVKLHPKKATAEELELWASACRDPERWVHHDIFNDERRSKVLRLMARHRRVEVEPKAWVEHIAKQATVEGSAAAVRIVASMSARDPELRAALAKARVLLLEDGSLDAPRRGRVFLPGGRAGDDQLTIDRVLAADPAVEQALKSLGIEIFDDAGSLRGELSKDSISWERVWSAARRLEQADAEQIFREVFGDNLATQLLVRTYSGRWKRPGEVFLPGPIIPGDGSRDGDFVVDHRFHQQELELLRDLGLTEKPRQLAKAPVEPWRLDRLRDVRELFKKRKHLPRISDESIDVDEGRALWPLQFLPRLSVAGRAAVTHSVLTSMTGEERWRIGRVGGGASLTVTDPMWTRIADHGVLRTEVGPEPIDRCLIDPVDDLEECDRTCLPYLVDTMSDEQAEALRMKSDPSDLSDEAWAELLHEASGWDRIRRFQLYAWAAACEQPAPDRIKVDRGPGHVEVAPGDAAVTASDDVHESLITAGLPAVKVNSEEDAEILVERWRLAVGKEMLVETVSTAVSGEGYLAIDRFPPLVNELGFEWHSLRVQPCSRIDLLTRTPKGELSRPLSSRVQDSVLFTTAIQDEDVLREIARATESSFKTATILQRMEKQRLNQLIAKISRTEEVEEKLVLAIGVDRLVESIPAAALHALRSSLGRELKDVEVAQLVVAVDGYSVLQNHRAALEANKLDPPVQWAGRGPARAWVRRLGFPVEFAGFTSADREAEVEVEGPPKLGQLHDYQQVISERIKELLTAPDRMNRGLVSLPTGAGKTRVAVQALIEYMRSTTGNVRIVWVAETDELCEQAVQTWSLIWRACGLASAPLTLSRLWGSNPANERDGYQVVVTSMSKLHSIIRRSDGGLEKDYAWLKLPAMIVVDEAHRSIAPQYTRTLSALGDARRVADMNTALLGLTATPFRGFNTEETRRLIGRYERRLDDGVFENDDVYGHLQSIGVLSKVRQTELDGAAITLTESELREAESLNQLANSVTDRLGKDERRNNTIVESILGLSPNSKVLLFATSTVNARVLAALISYHGLPARAVDADTPRAARRRYIEDFKRGDVRVLTNYSVFAEGFDVPAVDAVYITRPTFSPNVYQQMIGRGLRGPLNGGSEEVLIVNVADNLTNFGKDFAFHHFDHLWKENP